MTGLKGAVSKSFLNMKSQRCPALPFVSHVWLPRGAGGTGSSAVLPRPEGTGGPRQGRAVVSREGTGVTAGHWCHGRALGGETVAQECP